MTEIGELPPLFLPRPEEEKKTVGRVLGLERQFSSLANQGMREIASKEEKLAREAFGIEEKVVEAAQKLDPTIEEKVKIFEALGKEFRKVKKEVQGGGEVRQGELEERFAPWKDSLLLLAEYRQTRAGREVSHPLRELDYWLSRGSSKELASFLDKLASTCQSPSLFWHWLVKEGVVTPELVENTQLIGDLVLLKRQNDLINVEAPEYSLSEKEIKVLRAKVFSPFLEKGLSPTLIEEAVEGRLQFEEDFSANTIAAFLNLKEEIERPIEQNVGKTMTRRKFLARSALLGVAVAFALTPPGRPLLKELVRGVTPGEGEGSKKESIPEETGKFEGLTEGTSPFCPHDFRPENSDPKEFQEASKQNIWELERPVGGYFRLATATRFTSEISGKGWKWLRDGMGGWQPVEPDKEHQHPELVMKAFFSQLVPSDNGIPVPYGYKVDKENTKIFLDNQLVAPEEYAIIKGDNGTFSIELKGSKDLKGRIELRIALAKAGEGELMITDPGHLSLEKQQELKKPLVDLEKMPGEVRNFVASLKVSGLSTSEKAKSLERYFQGKFIYALEPKWSDYYQQGKTPTEFTRRILEIGRVDCDVANTVSVMFLRELGIPSRMSFGFMNNGSFLDKNSRYLSGSERHGWVEYFDGEKWQVLDATPTKIDEKTFQEIKNNLRPSVPDLTSISPKELLELYLYQLKDLIRDYKTGIGVSLGLLSYLVASYALGRFYRKEGEASEAIAKRITEKVEKMRKEAFGKKTENFRRNLFYFINDFTRRRFFPEGNLLTRPLTLMASTPRKLVAERERMKNVATSVEGVKIEKETTPLDFIARLSGLTPQEAAEEVEWHNRDFLERALSYQRDELLEPLAWVKTPQGNVYIPSLYRALTRRINYEKITEEAETPEEALDRVAEIAYIRVGGLRDIRYIGRPRFKRWGIYFPDPFPHLPAEKEKFKEIFRQKIERPMKVLWYLSHS